MSRIYQPQSNDLSDYVLCPAGTMTATVIAVAFCGRHPQVWQGEERIKELIGFQYEVSETGPDGRPLSILETMPFSNHEKSRCYARLAALWGGTPPAGSSFKSLPGKSCILSVAHVVKGDKTWANIIQVGAIPKGLSGPAPSVQPLYYDLLDPADSCPFESLPRRFKHLAETALSEDYRPAPPPPPRPVPPAQSAAWSGSHAAQAPQYRHAAPPPIASPADDVPFDDSIPF